MGDTSKQTPAALSDDCTYALRDVRFGEQLVARKEAPEAMLLPLVATKAAIEEALSACKAQPPEAALKRKQIEIDERIEQTEDRLLQQLPKLPTDRKIGRRGANIS